MNVFNLEHEEFEKHCTSVKDEIVATLYRQGLISQETYKDYVLNYAVLVRKPSFFNQFWEKFTKSEHLRFIVVKQKTLVDDESQPEDNKPDLKIIPFDNGKDKEEKD